ncbi:hypothetical protein [Gracilimonas sp.]|uniref:hypothetical protein n=1 Tax=Gracilimonas sp. TaxID=1974203 RepID=UPI0032F03A01
MFDNTYTFVVITLVALLMVGCSVNSNKEEYKLEIKNCGSVDIEAQSLRFISEADDGSEDTLYYDLGYLASNSVSDFFQIEETTKQAVIEWPKKSNSSLHEYISFGEFDSPLTEGTYSLTLKNSVNLYSESVTPESGNTIDSIRIRIRNNTDLKLNSITMTLDQERPKDPNNLLSRLSVKKRSFLI